MESLVQDVRHAVRQLAKNPGFSALAIATFALGIGPATAVLSFADRLLLSPLPGVSDASRLAEMQFGIHNPPVYSPHFIAGAEYAEFVRDLPAISAIAGYQGTSLVVATGNTPAEQRMALFVPADYFRVLGLRLELGRPIQATDDRPDAAMVAVISHNLWEKTFARAPDVLGKTFRANGEVLTVIGVAPRGFRGTSRLDQTDVWMPGAAQGLVSHYPPEIWPRLGYYEFILKLAPGATFDGAQDQLRVARTRIAALHPEDKDYEKLDALVFPGVGVRPFSREATGTAVRLLLGVTALLLVVACANAANLLLFRGTQRRGETAVRQAIGASRGRLITARMVESGFLATAGCIAGAVLAVVMVRVFEGVNILTIGAVEGVTINWRVLAWSLVAAIGTGLAAGLLPALAAGRVDLVSSLKETQRTGTSGRSRLRGGLAVLQLAISLTLLVGSFLFVRTLANLRNVKLGFNPSHLNTFVVGGRGLGYTADRMADYGVRLVERLRATPGIDDVSLSSTAPLVGGGLSDRILKGVAGSEDTIRVGLVSVAPAYFSALGMTLLSGRNFTDAEVQTQPASESVIISQGLASVLFGNADPIGQPIRFRRPPLRTVVGVVGDAVWNGLNSEPAPDLTIYETMGGLSPRSLLLVRSSLDDNAAQKLIRDVATSVDPFVPLSQSRTMRQVVDRHSAEQALFMKILTLLAFVAISLASVGLYGLVAQSAAERKREFGVRVAIGADKTDILSLVVRQGARLVLIGVPIGLFAAVVFGRLVRAKLFGVAPADPVAYGAAVVGLVLVALIASFLPARSATRVDPMIALRSE